MKNAIVICLFAVAASASCFCQLRNMVTDAVTDPDGTLRSAKKVAVFIELGTPVDSQGAYYVPDFARAKKQVTEKLKKAKLEAVANPSEADVVIVVHEVNEGANTVTICLGDKLDVYKGGRIPAKSDTPIFSVNEYCGISWPLNRAMDKLLRAMKR
ncbi:MAG: hypothetical protein WCF17_02665 [Terracidiphilus sp.]